MPLQTTWRLGEVGLVAAAARREDPDVLHLEFPGARYGRGFGACFVPAAMRLRGHHPLLVTTLHEFTRLRLRNRLRLGLAVSVCDLVIAPDPTLVASIRRQLKWRPGLHTEMIPLTANVWPTQSPAARPPAGEPTGAVVAAPVPGAGPELVVGYWGFLRPDKGVESLLEAFAQVLRTRPAALVLAGDPGPENEYAASLRTLAEKLGISGATRYTGPLPADRLSAELLSFDACVLPFREGLTQNRGTYAGSVAHGLYVVTTAGETRGFDPDSNTTFVAPNDAAALAAAILDAPDHPRKPATGTSDAAWDEIAHLHVAAYARAR